MKKYLFLIAVALLVGCEDDPQTEYFDTTGLVEVKLTRNLTPEGFISNDQNNYDIAKEMCRIYPAVSKTYYFEPNIDGTFRNAGPLYEENGDVAKAGWYTDGQTVRYYTGSINVATFGFTRTFGCK